VKALLVLALACVSGCGSSEACTELGCDNEANIAFTGSRPEGPYDLIVQTDGGTFMARCADPTAPEVADNDPEVQCTLNSFSLVGDAATGHSVFATVVPVGTDPLVENAEVLLSTVEEHRPNGEDCPPVCFSRAGQLVLDAT
jgi:hypothetical protein